MTWHELTAGPHTGKVLPEAFFADPAYVFAGIESGEFDGATLAEAVEVRYRAARIRVPRGEHEAQEVVVLYHLLPDQSFGGYVIVAKSDPRLAEYEQFATARSEGLDVTMPHRIAPADRTAAKGMVSAVLFHLYGDPHRRLTREVCQAFFDDPANFLDELHRAPRGKAARS